MSTQLDTRPQTGPKPVRRLLTDWQIMGPWWVLLKPICWFIELEGRLIDWRNRHLNNAPDSEGQL